jgi:hypothetical protein
MNGSGNEVRGPVVERRKEGGKEGRKDGEITLTERDET